jgi:hypothetical protein
MRKNVANSNRTGNVTSRAITVAVESKKYYIFRVCVFVALRIQHAMCSSSSSSPVTGLEWPRGFQEVKVPRFLDNGTGWW